MTFTSLYGSFHTIDEKQIMEFGSERFGNRKTVKLLKTNQGRLNIKDKIHGRQGI